METVVLFRAMALLGLLAFAISYRFEGSCLACVLPITLVGAFAGLYVAWTKDRI